MIPLRDTIPSRRFPITNIIFIVINVLVFLFEALLGPSRLDQVLWTLGFVPNRFWQQGGLGVWGTIFTSMFMHGGWWPLISNMIALYIFGDNVEDRFGHLIYPAFYIGGGIVATLAHAITNANSQVPTVGASGAIAAVLGAYLILYPQSRVVTLVPVFYFLRVVQLPALLYLGFWFVSQLLNGLFSLQAADALMGGVAWWAHIGGFVFGMAGGAVSRWLLGPRHSRSAYQDNRDRWYDRYRR